MLGRLIDWTTPRNKNDQYNYSWNVIRKQPLWHTWELGCAIVVSLMLGFLIGLVF